MSRFFSQKYNRLEPYTPGEQPKERKYVKLNTNESPYPPSPRAIEMAEAASRNLQLYSDPTASALVNALADTYQVAPNEVLPTNGSDEILNFAFMAFCDAEHPALFADITYGFYSVFAELNGVPYETIPLREDFSVSIDDYINRKGTIFIANPNAPTGIALPLSEIERLLQSDPDRIVVVDEAYVDFGAESAVSLIHKYDNLLVTQTFSKSRSMAGARLGYGIACRDLIQDLNTIKYSTNPYNVNSMTMAAGVGTLSDADYTAKNCQSIIDNRAYTAKELASLGFEMTDSKANFLFAKHPVIDGKTLYTELRARGILVRHFEKPRISDYNRITVGSREQMEILIQTIRTILEENK
ncbi:MAG: histidinol-phosphate transaminase [Clostridia bacterium]|nr:histidinol-phosphate transaminase [Clostridia bacterium]